MSVSSDRGVKRVIDFYRDESKVYDEKRFSKASGRYGDLAEKEIILGMVDNWEGKRVVEVGCGTGRFSIEMAKRGAIVTALDPAIEMLARVDEKIRNIPIKGTIKLINGSGYNLPFGDNQFDGCICLNVLNHLRDWDKVFSEIHRVVKPDGFFIMNFTNMLSLYFPVALWVNLRQRSVLADVYSRWDVLFQVKKELYKAGFNPERITGIASLPYFFPLRMNFLWGKVNDLLANSALKQFIANVYIHSRKRVQ